MIHGVGVNTDNFYKFTATLSLVATIYFLSFGELFLNPHNNRISERNIEKSKLGADKGYLTGVTLDLFDQVKDSLKNGDLTYLYFEKGLYSDSVKYYSTRYLTADIKRKVDTLNRLNRDLAEVLFRMRAIQNSDKVFIRNINIKSIASNILGVISLLIFLISLLIWFKKRDTIDR